MSGPEDVYTGRECPEVLDYLLKRRSAKIEDLTAPGPTKDQLEQIITAASRVPDHGKMCPWYFIVFKGEARAQVGEIFAQIYSAQNPDARADKVEAERARFMRAPVVVALISRMRTGKKPLWEQVLSAGAAGMNLSLAAHALGFGVQWVTEWYGYDAQLKAALGLDARDHVAGFFYIGTAATQPEERERPLLGDIVTFWAPGQKLSKGDKHDVEKLGFPDAGFDLSSLK